MAREGDRRPKGGIRSFLITPTDLHRWTYLRARETVSTMISAAAVALRQVFERGDDVGGGLRVEVSAQVRCVDRE